MRTSLKLAGGLAALVLASGCLPGAGTPASEVAAPSEAPEPEAPAPELLQAASGGDGDSWRDTTGREYRLGMVDTPEVGECFSREATAERTRLVAAGFFADAYTTDRYDRDVSVVTASDGTNVNVHLARHGFADDRYLARFRHENTALARQLDAAFAAAKAEGAGLWGACRSQVQGLVAPPPAAPPPAPAAGADCHPDDGDGVGCDH